MGFWQDRRRRVAAAVSVFAVAAGVAVWAQSPLRPARPAATRAAKPASVQDELRKLYERDGHEMPVMDLDQLPVPDMTEHISAGDGSTRRITAPSDPPVEKPNPFQQALSFNPFSRGIGNPFARLKPPAAAPRPAARPAVAPPQQPRPTAPKPAASLGTRFKNIIHRGTPAAAPSAAPLPAASRPAPVEKPRTTRPAARPVEALPPDHVPSRSAARPSVSGVVLQPPQALPDPPPVLVDAAPPPALAGAPRSGIRRVPQPQRDEAPAGARVRSGTASRADPSPPRIPSPAAPPPRVEDEEPLPRLDGDDDDDKDDGDGKQRDDGLSFDDEEDAAEAPRTKTAAPSSPPRRESERSAQARSRTKVSAPKPAPTPDADGDDNPFVAPELVLPETAAPRHPATRPVPAPGPALKDDADKAAPVPAPAPAPSSAPVKGPALTQTSPPPSSSAARGPSSSRAGEVVQVRAVAVEHCLVSLRNERKLIPARAEHAVEHGGRTYCFASEKAAEAFQANPPRYLPAFEGLDPVRLSDGERRAGSLQHALWFRGRLYLFASPSTQAAFEADPADYAE